jgi:hypothetical protein
MLAGAALLGVSFVVYGLGHLQWPPIYILDATRTTPLFFILASLLAMAALIARPDWPVGAAIVALAAAILVQNLSKTGAVALTLALPLAFGLLRGARGVLPLVAATAAILVIVLPKSDFPRPYSNDLAEGLGWIAAHTPQDALFIIPVGLQEFRELTRRSAYVDFKSFSVGQPAQAMMTRLRMEEVAQPGPAALALRGFPVVAEWEAAQHRAATCTGMADLMRRTGADYTVLRTLSLRNERLEVPRCQAPVLVYENAALAVFRAQ